MIQLCGADLQRFHDGDEVVFRRIVEAHSPRLLAYVRSFARDEDEARDLLQDAWHRAYQKRRAFTARGTLLGWLYAVCRTVGLNAAKRKEAIHAGDPSALEAGSAYRPDAWAETAALRQSLRSAVGELPERERDVVVLRLLEQCSTRETADRLRIAEGTVKATLHHAIKKLRTSMEAWAP